MKKIVSVLFVLFLCSPVLAQVPPVQYQDNTGAGDYYSRVHTDPLYGLSANPWERYRDTGAISSERVSTPWNQTTYYPVPPTDEYIGQKTTWNTAMGQTEMAPEVNIHNMLVMTRYLRKLGYQIPASFDTAIINAPAQLHERILSSLSLMSQDHGDPVSKASAFFISEFEDQSGLSIENLISNSLRILGNEP